MLFIWNTHDSYKNRKRLWGVKWAFKGGEREWSDIKGGLMQQEELMRYGGGGGAGRDN